jgi:predicted DCC family thiol-disulfide oxidoreductase YuxK
MPPDSPFTTPEGPEGKPRTGATLVALFDGACGVCTRAAAWTAARDPAGCIERLDLRQPTAALRFPGLSPEAVRASLHVVDGAGVQTVGVDAVARLLGEIPRWRWAGALLGWTVVRGFAAPAYQAFAARRLWFNRYFPLAHTGCDATCSHPVEGTAATSLDRPASTPPAPRIATFVDGRAALRPPRAP